ncbi:MAG: energy transducer TonB [Bacteroidota bacterium]
MNDFAVSSNMLLIGLLCLCVLVLGVIFLMRTLLSKRTKQDWSDLVDANTNVVGRNKYPAVNAFKWSNTFFMLALTIALGIVVMAFNWTQYEERVFILEDLDTFTDDLTQEPPRTSTPPPPLPLPPPPVIEEVPEEELVEEEEIEFVDMTIDEATTIAPPPKAVAKPSTPPPPLPPTPEEEDPIFVVVEDMPRFAGCEKITDKQEAKQCSETRLMQFLYKHLKYPSIAKENGIDGICVVKFTVERDGRVSDIELVRDKGGGLGTESMRVVKLMQQQDIRWRPGMQRGKPVRVRFTLPVKFKLQ